MATEVNDTPLTPDKQVTLLAKPEPILVDTPTKPSSIQELVAELLSVLEKQEVELFSISCSDVNETAQSPLSRAKAGNKEALVKLAEVMEALKRTSLDITVDTDSYSPRKTQDSPLNDSLTLSPIPKLSESKLSPPGSPSKYFHTLSFSKHQKRSSFGGITGLTGPKAPDHHRSLDDSADKPNSLSMSADIRPERPKKERRSITQFLTLKPQRPPPSMSHSSSTPAVNTTVRTDVVALSSPPSLALAANDSKRSQSLPASPVAPYKQKEKLQADDGYTLQIHETSRMLFEKKRNLMQQHNSNVPDISA